MNAPIYKHPALWIALVVALAAGVSVAIWFAGSSGSNPASAPPAVAINPTPAPTLAPPPPLTPTPAPRGTRNSNLDTSKKTYPWQVATRDAGLLDSTPPQVVVVPTEFAAGAGGWGSGQRDRFVGINMPLTTLLRYAYKWTNGQRLIMPAELRNQRFDYIANLPTGSVEAMQAEMQKKLGLAISRENITTNSYILRVVTNNAPGLKPGTSPQAGAGTRTPNVTTLRNVPIGRLATSLETLLGAPVLDETGLTDRYDIEYPMIRRTQRAASPDLIDEARKAMLDSLGLDLVSTNAPAEYLVIKKIN